MSGQVVVEVQGKNQKFYQVNLTNQWCPCSGYREQGRCNHLAVAYDIYNAAGKKHRWDVMSAFHKEIRRGDLCRGLMWARCFARITGMEAPANYIMKAGITKKNVLFEETRNLDLLAKIVRKEISHGEIIRHMIRSRKKWECDYYKDHVRQWIAGFDLYYANKEVWSSDHKASHLRDRINNYSSPEEAYEIVFFMRSHRDLCKAFHRMMWDRADDTKNDRLKSFLTLVGNEAHYEWMTALEIGIGYWDDEANDYAPDETIGVNFIPSFSDSYFDCHSFLGSKRLLACWDKIQPNRPIPETARVDMRWTGMIGGILWRFECWRQHGQMQKGSFDIEWEDVVIDEELWKRAIDLDSYFYHDFYKKLKSQGYDVPVWRDAHGS